MAQRPSAIGLLVCERVIYEAGTNNATPVGRFTQLAVPELPGIAAPFVVFAILTDGQGEVPVELVILHPDGIYTIYLLEGTLHLTGFLQS